MRTLWLLVLVGLGAPALAQEAASPLPAPQDPAVFEEVVVPGRRPENLRVEIERLEVAVYERFNTLNTNDEYDIHCFERAPTGSNIPLRTCAPNFVIQAESRSAKKMLHDGRTGMGNNNNRAEQRQLMETKGRELTEEMQRIAREDEAFMRDLARLDALKRLQSADEERR